MVLALTKKVVGVGVVVSTGLFAGVVADAKSVLEKDGSRVKIESNISTERRGTS